jgi:hypothetical protein
MKTVFWIAVAFCAILAFSAIRPGSPTQEGYVMLSRLLALALSLLFGILALGIKKRKSYGWWTGSVVLWLMALGFIGNIANVSRETDRAFIVWIVVSQLLSAAVPIVIYVKWWRPKRNGYFRSGFGH